MKVTNFVSSLVITTLDKTSVEYDSHVAGSWGTKYNGYRIVEVFENGQILTYQMNPKPMKKVNNTEIR